MKWAVIVLLFLAACTPAAEEAVVDIDFVEEVEELEPVDPSPEPEVVPEAMARFQIERSNAEWSPEDDRLIANYFLYEDGEPLVDAPFVIEYTVDGEVERQEGRTTKIGKAEALLKEPEPGVYSFVLLDVDGESLDNEVLDVLVTSTKLTFSDLSVEYRRGEDYPVGGVVLFFWETEKFFDRNARVELEFEWPDGDSETHVVDYNRTIQFAMQYTSDEPGAKYRARVLRVLDGDASEGEIVYTVPDRDITVVNSGVIERVDPEDETEKPTFWWKLDQDGKGMFDVVLDVEWVEGSAQWFEQSDAEGNVYAYVDSYLGNGVAMSIVSASRSDGGSGSYTGDGDDLVLS